MSEYPHILLRVEEKPLEHRSFSPAVIKTLVDAGYPISVERSSTDPKFKRIFEDSEYEAAGARLVDTGVWPNAEPGTIILGLKEIPEEDFPLKNDHITFAHCYKNQGGWEKVLGRWAQGGSVLYDLEFLHDSEGRRVSAFGFHAGFAGAALGIKTLAHQLQDSSSKLPSVETFTDGRGYYLNEDELVNQIREDLAKAEKALGRKPTALVLGALGRCGKGAVDLFLKAGMPDENITRWDLNETRDRDGPYEEIAKADVFLNAIYLSKPIPPFINQELLAKQGRNLAVVIDVSCDTTNPHNPIPIYSINTTFANQTLLSKPSQLKPHFQVPIPHWALFVLDWILDSCVRVRLTQPDLTCSSFHPLFPGICICSSSFTFLNPTSQQILPIMSSETKETDYSLANPDTLTKYKTAAQISEKVLAEVSKLVVPGAKIVDICQQGDKLIEEEVAKVYRGKKINKGFSHPTTVSPSSYVTPYTPLTSDEAEANTEIKDGEAIKIQLGAQIDGFGSIVCDTVIATPEDKAGDKITGRTADLVLANYYVNELLLRLMIPPGLLAQGSEEEKAKATSQKAPTQAKITSLLEKVTKAYEVNLVESTTSWLFDHNEIEGSKKIVLAPAEGTKGEGVPEIGEVWGVETGVSLGSGKVKGLDQRATLHRRTNQTYGLKRPTSRKILNEVQKKFGIFPFSLRQLEDERDAKSGVVECVRGNVFRQYELVGDKDNSPVARYLTTLAITKNGITKLGGPPPLDLEKYESDKKIEDEEVLKILEQPLARNTGKKKSKPKKKTAKKEDNEE